MHNVLSFLLYFVFSVQVSRALFNKVWVQVTLLSMLLLQRYLLDFFSVSRGWSHEVSKFNYKYTFSWLIICKYEMWA